DQPAQQRLACDRAIARLEQCPRRLGSVEVGPADERLMCSLEHVLAAARLAEVDGVLQQLSDPARRPVRVAGRRADPLLIDPAGKRAEGGAAGPAAEGLANPAGGGAR